jgi:hypothetical protein
MGSLVDHHEPGRIADSTSFHLSEIPRNITERLAKTFRSLEHSINIRQLQQCQVRSEFLLETHQEPSDRLL